MKPLQLDLDLTLGREGFSGNATFPSQPGSPFEVELHDLSVVAVSGGVTLANGSEEVTRLAVDPSQSSTIQYEGMYRKDLVGLYAPDRSMGDSSSYLVTQLESEHAPKVFPALVDEYSRRYEIQLEVSCRSDWIVLSNGVCLDRRAEGDETVVSTFGVSPLVIADTFALVAGPLIIGGTAKAGCGMGVELYGFESIEESAARLALDAACFAVDRMWELFGEVDVKELQLVAVPDFGFGAMENPGCMVFRESALIHKHVGDRNELNRVVRVICHEVAHLWFGHRVGIARSTDAWIKEGLASQFERLLAERFLGSKYDAEADAQGLDLAARFDGGLAGAESEPATGEDAYSPVTYNKTCAVLEVVRDADPSAYDSRLGSICNSFKYTAMDAATAKRELYPDRATELFGGWGGPLHAAPSGALLEHTAERPWFVTSAADRLWWEAVLNCDTTLVNLAGRVAEVGVPSASWMLRRIVATPQSLRMEWTDVLRDYLSSRTPAPSSQHDVSLAMLALHFGPDDLVQEVAHACRLQLEASDLRRLRVALGDDDGRELREGLLGGVDVDWRSSVLAWQRPSDGTLLSDVLESASMSPVQVLSVYRSFSQSGALRGSDLERLLEAEFFSGEIGASLQYQLAVLLVGLTDYDAVRIAVHSGVLDCLSQVPIMSAQAAGWLQTWLAVTDFWLAEQAK